MMLLKKINLRKYLFLSAKVKKWKQYAVSVPSYIVYIYRYSISSHLSAGYIVD